MVKEVKIRLNPLILKKLCLLIFFIIWTDLLYGNNEINKRILETHQSDSYPLHKAILLGNESAPVGESFLSKTKDK